MRAILVRSHKTTAELLILSHAYKKGKKSASSIKNEKCDKFLDHKEEGLYKGAKTFMN